MRKEIKLTVSLEVVPREEWSDIEIQMVENAKRVVDHAHAPYSNFMVGASLLLENGKLFEANNQENVSFPVGVCAERAVLSYAMGNFPDTKPIKIIIVAKRRNDQVWATVTPCGLCRQTINEYEVKFGSPIEIMMLNPQGELLRARGIDQLLPFRFNDLNG
ncbi:cytidine deaminase [Arthrospiribacter ruber]|uniref:Cytidine deaminase n=1 Tax=Arthrospiribacter ruber TaxID=2487934 RepID=A0A951J065_9BACT|nr:cytidine deaminase [Arthrospiribacter ruber]MBW3468788.1 cytidine deaminase [Arthrospiribacter ruber]